MNSRLSLIACLALLSGCMGSPRRVGTWIDPTASGFHFKKPMVAGINGQGERRRTMEYEAMEAGKAAGIELLPAASFLPEDLSVTKDVISKVVKDQGFDAVITFEVIREGEKVETIPGGTTSLESEYFDAFLNHYVRVRQEVLLPDKNYTVKVFRIESKLYDTKTSKIVWSGTWKVQDSPGFAPMMRDVAAAALSEIKSRGYH